MISQRQALLRQAQEYFRQLLTGVVKWDDVIVDKAIPIPPVKGWRDQGKVKDVVVASFNGFRMEMFGPFEDENWPLGKVKITKGAISAHGPLDPATWVRIADFIKEQKRKGGQDGTQESSSAADAGTAIGAGTAWGR